MTIAKYDRPVYKLTCDTCGTDATHDDGMPWYFESRDVAAIWARDFEWDGPWCLNDGVPTHCPDCARARSRGFTLDALAHPGCADALATQEASQ
jgi:hypothetical protein